MADDKMGEMFYRMTVEQRNAAWQESAQLRQYVQQLEPQVARLRVAYGNSIKAMMGRDADVARRIAGEVESAVAAYRRGLHESDQSVSEMAGYVRDRLSAVIATYTGGSDSRVHEVLSEDVNHRVKTVLHELLGAAGCSVTPEVSCAPGTLSAAEVGAWADLVIAEVCQGGAARSGAARVANAVLDALDDYVARQGDQMGGPSLDMANCIREQIASVTGEFDAEKSTGGQ